MSLFQEVDRIITQMMRAGDYLGWDVTELRPVSASLSFKTIITYRYLSDVDLLSSVGEVIRAQTVRLERNNYYKCVINN